MFKVKAEAITALRGRFEERIKWLSEAEFNRDQVLASWEPEESKTLDVFVVALGSEDMEEIDCDAQPTLLSAPVPEHVSNLRGKERRQMFCFRHVYRMLDGFYPFAEGSYVIPVGDRKISSVRSAAMRCFHGSNHIKDPELAKPIWPEFDASIEEIDGQTLKIHIWKKD